MAAERTDARIYCRLPFERVPAEVDRKLHGSLIFLELISDVFLYLLSVFPNRVDVVPTAPEFSVPVLEFRVPPLLVDHQGRFALEVSHYPGNREFGRDRNQHVHVVGADLGLVYRDPLPFAELPKDLSDLQPLQAVELLPPVLRRENHVVLTVPAGVR